MTVGTAEFDDGRSAAERGTTERERGVTASEAGLSSAEAGLASSTSVFHRAEVTAGGALANLTVELLQGRLAILRQQLNMVRLFRRIAETSVPAAPASAQFRIGTANGEALLGFALDELRQSLTEASAGPSPPVASLVQFAARVELVQLGTSYLDLFIVSVRALEAAIEDRTPTATLTALATEAGLMASGLEATLQQMSRPTVDAALVSAMERQAEGRLQDAARFIDQFTLAERRAGTWWAKVEVPLSLIEGITIPVYGIVAKDVIEAGDFAAKNLPDLQLANERAGEWLSSLSTMYRAAPTITTVVLFRAVEFILSGNILLDFLRGVTAKGVAFLIGRIIRGSLNAPSPSFDTLLEVIQHCLDIWGALHALPNVARSVGERAVEEARAAVERALRDLKPPITAGEIRLVAVELLKSETRDALAELGRFDGGPR